MRREFKIRSKEEKAIDYLLTAVTGVYIPTWSILSCTEGGEADIYIIMSHDVQERFTVTRRYILFSEDSWSIELLPVL